MKHERDLTYKFSIISLETEEATEQGMKAASRSKEWPPVKIKDFIPTTTRNYQ